MTHTFPTRRSSDLFNQYGIYLACFMAHTHKLFKQQHRTTGRQEHKIDNILKYFELLRKQIEDTLEQAKQKEERAIIVIGESHMGKEDRKSTRLNSSH